LQVSLLTKRPIPKDSQKKFRKSFCNGKNPFFFEKRVKIKINKYNKYNEKIKIKNENKK